MEFYVFPHGKDANDGGKEAPFKTLERAAAEVRKFNKAMQEDIIVYIGGKNVLSGPLRFTPEDSGFNGYNVIYRALDKNAVVSGEKTLENWTLDDEEKGIWKASAQGRRIRQIYADGIKANCAFIHGIKEWTQTDSGYIVPDGSIDSWRNKDDMEFIYHCPCWEEGRICAEKVSGNEIILKQPAYTMGRTGVNLRYTIPKYICNVYNFIENELDWCVDTRTDTVYLKSGADPNNRAIIYCDLEKLIEAEGTFDAPVHNLIFDGLTFKYTTWWQPNTDEGFTPTQANLYNLFEIEPSRGTYYWKKSFGAVGFTNAHDIKVLNCDFTALNTVAALSFEIGCHNSEITANYFHDIGGSAIQIGDMQRIDAHPNWDDLRRRVYNFNVHNNYITRIGREYKGSIGVLVGHAAAVTIAHNEIGHIPYTAVSLGWGWGGNDFDALDPTMDGRHRVHHNYVHHHMLEMSDGGAFYTLGAQPGTIVENNVVHGGGYYYLGTNLYFDDFTQHVQMLHNVVHSVDCSVSMKGDYNVLMHNYFENVDSDTYHPLSDNNVTQPNTIVKDGNFPLDHLNWAGLERDYLYLLGPAEGNVALNKETRTFDGNQYRDSKKDEANSKAVTDGDYTTWTETLGRGSGFLVDLGRDYQISALALSFGGAAGQYAVESTCDGLKWERLADIKDAGARRIISFDAPKYMRDLRIKCVSGQLNLTQIEAYTGECPARDGDYHSFELVPSKGTLFIGESAAILLKGIYEDGMKERYPGNVEFTSSDPGMISVENNAVLKIHKAGKATITAEFAQRQLSITLEACVDTLESVTISTDREFYHTGESGLVSVSDITMRSGKKINPGDAEIILSCAEGSLIELKGYEFSVKGPGLITITSEVLYGGTSVRASARLMAFIPGWDYAFIGAGSGYFKFDGDTWESVSASSNIFFAADDFIYLYQPINLEDYPDGISIQTAVQSIENVSTDVTHCGLMLRSSLSRASANVMYRTQSIWGVDGAGADFPWYSPFTWRLKDRDRTQFTGTKNLPLGTLKMLSYKDNTAYAHYWDESKKEWVLAYKLDNIELGTSFNAGIACCSASLKSSEMSGIELGVMNCPIKLD